MKTFLISDTHFGHKNILTFTKADGSKLRDFPSIEAMDEYIIQQWNKTVGPNDKVYHLGDVGFKNATSLGAVLSRLNGTKVLIKGNHDNQKLSIYQQYFKDVRGTHTLDRFILSHIPIHPDSLYRWKANIHGHLHADNLDDGRYFNVAVEQWDYTPVDFEFIRTHYS